MDDEVGDSAVPGSNLVADRGCMLDENVDPVGDDPADGTGDDESVVLDRY